MMLLNTKGQPGYNVLDTAVWTPEVNRAWLDEALARGDDFLLLNGDVSGVYRQEVLYILNYYISK